MKLAPEIENALDRSALEQDITREEALAVIARDWLTGHGYLVEECSEEGLAPRLTRKRQEALPSRPAAEKCTTGHETA